MSCEKTSSCVVIDRKRYDELIRTETKYNLLRNALEDEVGYTDINGIKKCFGITNERKEKRVE